MYAFLETWDKRGGEFCMTREEWLAMSAAEKAERTKRQSNMANHKKQFPRSPRAESIISCQATDVTQEELKRLLQRLRQQGYPEEKVGAIRIHYDHLVDDAEKQVRHYLGLENDYGHTVTDCRIIKPCGAFYGFVDGLHIKVWCLLYMPERANRTKTIIEAAIRWCKWHFRHEEADMLHQLYHEILNQPPPQFELSEYEKRLVREEVFLPCGTYNIKRAIDHMTQKGFYDEAAEVAEKYAWLLGSENLNTPSEEELDALFEELLAPYKL